MNEIQRIRERLRAVLLNDEPFSDTLFDYELVEHIEYHKVSRERDNDDFLFVITENSGDVAMMLIDSDGHVYKNKYAQLRLRMYWPGFYDTSIKQLLPKMAEDLANGYAAVNGCHFIDNQAK